MFWAIFHEYLKKLNRNGNKNKRPRIHCSLYGYSQLYCSLYRTVNSENEIVCTPPFAICDSIIYHLELYFFLNQFFCGPFVLCVFLMLLVMVLCVLLLVMFPAYVKFLIYRWFFTGYMQRALKWLFASFISTVSVF